LSNPILKHPKFTKESGQFLYDFYILSKALKRITQPSSMIEKIRASKFYNTIIDNLAAKRGQLKDGSTDEKLKAEALDRIKRKGALLFDLAKPYQEHERYINAMVLGSQDLTKGEGVNLLSVHASKGLEYKEVYVIDLMDGRFPNRKLMNKGGGGIDEERRLFYVSVTRAKDILYLSYAKNDKIKKIDFVPSQFLYEAGLIKKDENYTKMVEKEGD
jgi:DNA helicase-2/ATP-dependent DNA helicase PcrA